MTMKQHSTMTGKPFASMRRWLVGCLIALVVCSPLFGRTDNPSVRSVAAAGVPPLLILAQQPKYTNRTEWIVDNAAYIDSLPFDGMTVNIPPSWGLMTGERMYYDDYYGFYMAPLVGLFTHMTHNFLEAHIDDPGDVFDDNAWDIVIANWSDFARAARDAGFLGFFFDNEQYDGQWLNYPEDYSNPTHSLQEYKDQTRLRGRQIGAAIVAAYPGITLLSYHSPVISEPKTPWEIRAEQTGPADEYELNGPLFTGFMEGMDGNGQLIDGGEFYKYRSASEFSQSYDWRRYGVASNETDSVFIPPPDRPTWSDHVNIAYGVFNQGFPSNMTMDPPTMRSTLENALRTTDRYVWYYTQGDNWLIPGQMPHAWFSAVEGARQAVGLSNPEDAATETPSATPTKTMTPSSTPTKTATATATATNTPTTARTKTATSSSTPTSTQSPASTPTGTRTATPSATASATPTATWTPTSTPSATASVSPTAPLTATSTPSATPSATPTQTRTATPAPTKTPTAIASPTRTATASPSPTRTATKTPSPTSTRTPRPTKTPTATRTPKSTKTPTKAPSNTSRPTKTPTATPTATRTPKPTRTPRPTRTPSAQPTATNTSAPTDVPTLEPTQEPTFEPSATAEDVVRAQADESFAYQIMRAGRSSGSTSTGLALDGDPSSAWMTVPGEQPPDSAFIYFDLGDVVPIGSINWLLTLEGGSEQWQIQLSYDRQDWTPIANLGGGSIGEWQSMDVGAEARYVRFVFINPTGAAELGGLAEVEIRS